MKKYGILILLIILAQSAFTQDIRPKMMEKVEAQKVAFFTQTLDLSVEESQAFWPVYNAYQEEQRALRANYKDAFRNKNMNEAEASQAIKDFFEKQEQELLLKRKLYANLEGKIPASKLVKLQVSENQFKQKLLERIKNRREGKRRK